MTAQERAALRALAEKATPGPWLHEDVGEKFGYVSTRQHRNGDIATTWGVGDEGYQGVHDAAYIAAAHPAAVLALLDEVERLGGALDKIAGMSRDMEHTLYGATCVAIAALERPA